MIGKNNLCIHQIFESRVNQSPNHVAVKLDNQTLTYRELNHHANQLAERLRALGVGPETIVAVYLERSFELIISILGILKAGGAYLPIDPTYPQQRVAFMLEDSRAGVLLTHRKLVTADQLPQVSTIYLEDTQLIPPGPEASANSTNNTSSDNLAYVIYTSGSTGKPKGVLVTHHNVVRLFEQTQSWFNFTSSDIWTLFHSCAFDFSVWEIWGALLYGGKLIIVPYMISRSPESFYDLLSREQVTVLNQTPSAFRQLVRIEQGLTSLKTLALRYIVFGGEALEMQSLKPWFERHGDKIPKLINMYGITETTVHVTYRPLTENDVDSGSVIGIPIPDLELHVLDPQSNPSPVGETGELYVGGPGLARGYLNRPELTAERFVAVSASQSPGGRLYRTGDLARRLPNQDIEYMGRIDQQVKIRGFRIELGEIETALARHVSILEAVVLAQEDVPGDKRLVAYLISRGNKMPEINDLRGFLRTHLPEYMVPSAFVFVDKFPLNNNGKLDRSALQALPSRPLPTPALTAALTPANDLERQILDLWQEALRGISVGLDNNFFDLGGDSLLLAQIHTRLQIILSREFPITDLFAHTTIRALASHFHRPEKPKNVLDESKVRAQRQREALSAQRNIRVPKK